MSSKILKKLLLNEILIPRDLFRSLKYQQNMKISSFDMTILT